MMGLGIVASARANVISAPPMHTLFYDDYDCGVAHNPVAHYTNGHVSIGGPYELGGSVGVGNGILYYPSDGYQNRALVNIGTSSVRVSTRLVGVANSSSNRGYGLVIGGNSTTIPGTAVSVIYTVSGNVHLGNVGTGLWHPTISPETLVGNIAGVPDIDLVLELDGDLTTLYLDGEPFATKSVTPPTGTYSGVTCSRSRWDSNIGFTYLRIEGAHPTVIPGLFSWLKPEHLGAVGTSITSWGTGSGPRDYINGIFTAPVVAQSGAHKYATFTGTERMESAVSTGGAPSERTVIAVVSPGVNKTQGMPIVGASAGTVGVLTTASLYPRVEEYGGTWQAVSGSTQMNLNQFNVVSATFSDVNNALAVARDLEPLTPVASNAGFALDRKLVLGGNGGSAGFIGGIAEVVIYNRVLSGAERESIIQYFKTKYGV